MARSRNWSQPLSTWRWSLLGMREMRLCKISLWMTSCYYQYWKYSPIASSIPQRAGKQPPLPHRPHSKHHHVVCSTSRNHTPSWITWMLALFLFELNRFRSTLKLPLPVAAISVHIRVPRNHNCTPLITSNVSTGTNCGMASVFKHATCQYQRCLSMCVCHLYIDVNQEDRPKISITYGFVLVLNVVWLMIIVASDCKVHVKYRFYCYTAMKLQFSRQVFEKYSNTKLHQNPSSGSRVLPCGQTGLKKLIVAFRNFANAPKKLLFAPPYLTARLSTSHNSAPTEWILAKFYI